MPLYIMVVIIEIMETTINIMVMVIQDITATDYGNMGITALDSDTRTLNITDAIKGLGFTKVTDTLGIIIIHVLYGIINDRPFGTLAIGKNLLCFITHRIIKIVASTTTATTNENYTQKQNNATPF